MVLYQIEPDRGWKKASFIPANFASVGNQYAEHSAPSVENPCSSMWYVWWIPSKYQCHTTCE